MANHKSADKRSRQTKRKTAVNSRIKSIVKTFEKKTLVALSEGKKDEAASFFKSFASQIDKAAKKGVYHKNKASRKISRLSLKLAKI